MLTILANTFMNASLYNPPKPRSSGGNPMLPRPRLDADRAPRFTAFPERQ